jgi:DNA topoisomerase-1
MRHPAVRRSRRSLSRRPPVTHDPLASAREAHLRYVDDAGSGFRRRRSGKGFRYLDAHGAPLRDRAHLERIRQLVIPPAWTDVWICPVADGHLQATGRDARGRKQYRYHARWREVRDESKYERTAAFAEALPRIRAAVARALEAPALTRDKVVATVVWLLEVTHIRVGNEEYARQNDSFGLTTLRETHVDVHGSSVRFHFRGKSGVEHAVDVRDKRVARVVRRCLGLPGELLFRCVGEDGTLHAIESADVNAYLHTLAGAEFSAKDFRTWAGTVLAAQALREEPPAETVTARKKSVTAAIKRVAKHLGNTPAVCRRCYVHPAIFEAYATGQLVAALAEAADARRDAPPHDLTPAEAAVLALIRGTAPVAAAA